jgi:nitrite reductase (NADH) large subunit
MRAKNGGHAVHFFDCPDNGRQGRSCGAGFPFPARWSHAREALTLHNTRLPATKVFADFSKLPVRLPGWLWRVLQLAVFLLYGATCAVLLYSPEFGLDLFWGIIVPVLPAALVVAPGIWRAVCPMALANQVPRMFGFGLEKTLPRWLADHAFTMAILLFVGTVALRQPLLNHNASVVALMLVIATLFAFAGGFVFKGRSGWCGTFCPLGPIQRDYGHAPALPVANTHCVTCVGCQKNCYDFAPEAALFDDINDEDPRYSGQRRFFMGMMPGMIAGYFLQLHSSYSYPVYLGIYIAAILASVGAYQLVISFIRADPARVASLFASAALGLFYVFAGPVVIDAIEDMTTWQLPPLAVHVIQGLGLGLAIVLAFNGLRLAKIYEKAAAAAAASNAVVPSSAASFEIRERSSGVSFHVGKGQTLLSGMLAAKLSVVASCRAGLCGSDAVWIIQGGHNLVPATDDEKATIKRLGLNGDVRLACQCFAEGPVIISSQPPQEAGDPKEASAEAVNAEPQIVARLITRQPQQNAARITVMDRLTLGGVRRAVIIGNGVAGMTAAEALRKASPSLSITIISAEPHVLYNRMAIARLVTGEDSLEQLRLLPADWAQQHNIDVRLNTRVASIDRGAKSVTTLHGETIRYDRLILATGARASVPSPVFLGHANAFVLRSAGDAGAISQFLTRAKPRRALVIGGGVLGIEAAEALSKTGLSVGIVHRGQHLMDRQIDEFGARTLERYLGNLKIDILTNARITGFVGKERLEALTFDTLQPAHADLFVAAIGNTPNTELARQCGLATAQGILVDRHMRTSDPAIFAIGDCAEFETSIPGLWATAISQAQVAAEAILNRSHPYDAPTQVLRLKSDGIELLSFGDIRQKISSADEVMTAPAFSNAWWRIVVRDGRVLNAAYAGPPHSAGYLKNNLRSGQIIAPFMDDLRAGKIDSLKSRHV